jgi:hypothetical protein
MKKFKYFTIFSLLLTTSIFVYKYNFLKDEPTQQISDWNSYKKKGKKLVSHTMTSKEIKEARLPVTKKRSPASKKINLPKKRIITGSLAKKYGSTDIQINYLNSPSKDWKERYAEFKLKTLPEGTKVLIKHNESILKVSSEGALYVEKVIISIQREGKAPSSYEAIVNSQTGEQMNAWNRTHHENVNQVLFSKKL